MVSNNVVAVAIPLPAVSQSLVDALSKKACLGEVSAVPELWRRIVFAELDWCSRNFGGLSYRQRLNACWLVDWHHSYYGYTREDWLPFYFSESEMFRRQTIAELNWCAAHLDELSPRRRMLAIEILEDFFDSCPDDYQSMWDILYNA